MKELLKMYNSMLDLSEAQRRVIEDGRLDEAIDMQKRRQVVLEEIQNFDSKIAVDGSVGLSDGSKNTIMEDLSSQIQHIIEKILSVDSEISVMIHSKIGFIQEKLADIQKLKAFCHTFAPHQEGGRLHINI